MIISRKMSEGKIALRKMARARVAAIDSAEKESRSAAIADRVKEHIAVSGARVVALYCPIGGEPLVWQLVEELSKVMSVALPRVEGDSMNFYCYDPAIMQRGAYGIMEPMGGEALLPHEIDIIVVPGVVFTKSGERMGRGKGYYDKYLSHPDFRGIKIGVCYSEQLVGSIPVEPHDVRMDYVIYE